jgi:hypothetical protein
VANFADGGIDAVFGVDEDFRTPEAFGDFRPGDELAIAGGQQDEQLHRLAFELEASTGASELKAVAIQLEVAEFEDGNRQWMVPPRVKYSIGVCQVWRIAFNSGRLLLHLIFTWKFTRSVLPPRRRWSFTRCQPGTFSFQAYDINGNPTLMIKGVLKATRITPSTSFKELF